ncbi:hypothetical protein MRX96_026214 [Rhipicephalus microplus]
MSRPLHTIGRRKISLAGRLGCRSSLGTPIGLSVEEPRARAGLALSGGRERRRRRLLISPQGHDVEATPRGGARTAADRVQTRYYDEGDSHRWAFKTNSIAAPK